MTTESLLERGQPSHTALRVASQRAAHQLLDEPIVLPDPIALPILGAQAEAAMREDPYAHNEPILRGLRASLVVRSRVAEDELARAVDAGVRQYVLLGAGLDTFAYRNPHAQVRVFEVDHPATQAWKRQCLHDADIALPSNLHFAPIDFERTSLADGLLVAGFDSLKPACFAWLGVTMYLTEAAIFSTLAYVASLPRRSSICFDYRVPEHRLDPVQKVIGALMASRAAAAGEPWISAFEPEALRERMLALGFAEVEALEPDLLNARYLARRKDGLRSGGRMMLARV